jgi:muramoyltetrapeptide carboxypeptidase
LIPSVRLPPPAGPGDRVGVAALSGPVDPERLERGLAALEGLGFVPVPAGNLARRHGLFAGSDEERLAAFHRLAADPSLAAVFFARGGHGVLRLLPGIDWELLARRPRAYIGYSDLTPLLLAIVARLGLAVFHGPMVAADLARGLDGREETSLLAALAGDFPESYVPGGWVRPGRAAGPLLGGCLSLLAATLGTPYAPDLDGAVLFWEDVNEPPYRIDRMLTHLRLSGNLAAIQGMIVGHVGWLGGWLGSGGPEPGEEPARWSEVVEEAVGGFSWPVAWGFPAGHLAPNLTLPLGLPARLDSATGLVLG